MELFRILMETETFFSQLRVPFKFKCYIIFKRFVLHICAFFTEKGLASFLPIGLFSSHIIYGRDIRLCLLKVWFKTWKRDQISHYRVNSLLYQVIIFKFFN